MTHLIRDAYLCTAVGILGMLRRGIDANPRLLVATRWAWMQPVLRWSCRLKALYVHRRAAWRCPAYRSLLNEQGVCPVARWSDFGRIPVTDKANYVNRYAIEARCYGGVIPNAGVVIDESSGSSGQPNNWVRGRDELKSVHRIIQHAYRLAYGDKPMIVINCFALGAWATGMNVTMSLADIAIIKSIGPDKQKLDNTLKQFGAGYRYLIAGYPPFLKNYADTAGVNLTDYETHLILGGEAMSEGMRDVLLRFFSTVRSSFGASDLEINIGVESPLTTALRKRCIEDTSLCQKLFGRPTPPMIFQYNPADFYVETNDDNELIFTVARTTSIAPKVRYNLHDEGGVMTFKQLRAALHGLGLSPSDLKAAHSALPLLYVYGRSDMTIAFYGANIYPADIEAIIHHNKDLASACHSFQLRVEERGDTLVPTLLIALERSESGDEPMPNPAKLRDVFIDGLETANQDFREVRRMFDKQQVVVEVHDYGTGPFSDRDIRIKSRYFS